MNYKIIPGECADQTWILPGSKSISNRVLMIAYYAGVKFNIKNLSDSTDTLLLHDLVLRDSDYINFKDAGTPYRFMLSALSNSNKNYTITGSHRLLQRPIYPLIQALQSLGADIHFTSHQILIKSSKLKGDIVTIDNSLSSQFLSSLLLLAPTLADGLTIRCTSASNSESYSQMTVHVLQEFGIEVTEGPMKYSVPKQSFQVHDYTVESDWSAASFAFLLAFASPSPNKIYLPYLFQHSIQGDSMIEKYARTFGMHSEWIQDTLQISVTDRISSQNIVWELSSTPDIVPVLVMLVVLSRSKACFKGISNLELKESKRISVLIEHLTPAKVLFEFQEDFIKIDASHFKANDLPNYFNPHQDHRMAMCFAALSFVKPGIIIKDVECVSKSFPNFWNQLLQMNFTLEEVDSF